MNSRIYTGVVAHARSSPVKHTLRYPLYFYCFDLDEIEILHSSIPLFSYNRFNITSLRDRDYLKGEGSIKKKLLSFLKENGVRNKISRVDLVTQARYLNYVFNPVSFYCCYSESGKTECAVAEVNNTFGEKHIYLLTEPVRSGDAGVIEFEKKKEFHVSPFNNMDGRYIFQIHPFRDSIQIKIVLSRDGKNIMTALLSGEGKPFTQKNLLETIIKFPLTTLITVPRIYKEAFKLFFLRKLSYNPKPEPQSAMTIGRLPATLIQSFALRVIEKVFSEISGGLLEVKYPDGIVRHFGDSGSKDKADITINGYSFFTKVLFNGEIGFGESFMENGWSSSDPVKLLIFFIRHLEMEEQNHVAMKWIGLLLNRILNRQRKNTISGSRRNICEHYDLGNDFFSGFLDRRLIYSCGIYRKKSDSLEQAQINKIERIIEKAGITEKDHVLEIGSGWGGFAVEAAKRTGCRVTTITLSNEQHNFVQKLIKKEQLQSRVKVELTDYRNMKGSFDKIVSIEMLEAVGYVNFGSYFSAIDRLLKPGGSAVLQVITTMDHHYSDYKRRKDWIQKHIFPGGHLPSVTALSESMAANSRLYIESLENIGPHYAATIREWRKRFLAADERLHNICYDSRFRKKWLYYFHVCEAGFAARIINDVIITLSRPGNMIFSDYLK